MNKSNSYKFDVNRMDFYLHASSAEGRERTLVRLTEIAEIGMEEVLTAEFGYRGVMSGLYIEKVWSYSDKEWNGYMTWAKGLIISELLNNLDKQSELVGSLSKRMSEGRHYLMGVAAMDLTVDDALEAFGFGRNGLGG